MTLASQQAGDTGAAAGAQAAYKQKSLFLGDLRLFS